LVADALSAGTVTEWDGFGLNYTSVDGTRDHIRISFENPSTEYPDEISLVPTRVFRAVVAELLCVMKGPMVYSNGQVARQEIYQDGLRHGEWLLFNEDGARKAHWNYSRGQRHGRRQWYYETGALQQEVHYNLGVLDGPASHWYRNGQICQRCAYTHGQYADGRSHETWDESGRLTFFAEYAGGLAVCSRRFGD